MPSPTTRGFWREIWSVARLGTKLSVAARTEDNFVSIGITNTLSRTGVAGRITLAEAIELHTALGEFLDENPLAQRIPANG